LIYRNLISALVVGLVSFGTGFQAYTDLGKLPDKFDILRISIPALVLMLNDIKSRITPTKGEKSA